jgi:hypothetical protein
MSRIHDHDPSNKYCDCQACKAAEDSAAASEVDSEWFERHPERTHLVRPATPGEIYLQCLNHGWETNPPSPCQWFTLVKQAMPGVRLRFTIPTLHCLPPFFCDEETAREVLETITKAFPRINGVLH